MRDKNELKKKGLNNQARISHIIILVLSVLLLNHNLKSFINMLWYNNHLLAILLGQIFDKIDEIEIENFEDYPNFLLDVSQ